MRLYSVRPKRQIVANHPLAGIVAAVYVPVLIGIIALSGHIPAGLAVAAAISFAACATIADVRAFGIPVWLGLLISAGIAAL